jgi:hypothetical protein
MLRVIPLPKEVATPFQWSVEVVEVWKKNRCWGRIVKIPRDRDNIRGPDGAE